MLKTVLLTMLLVYLPMAHTISLMGSPGQGFNVLEANKEMAYQLECSLEAVEERVESAFEKGEISEEKWEQFKQLHWETKSFLHLFIMANLYYEEAPVKPYGKLVELFAVDLVRRVVLLDRFCIEIGIEAIPFEMM